MMVDQSQRSRVVRYARLLLMVAAIALVFSGVERWGNGVVYQLGDFVAAQGRLGILFFIGVNAVAVMFIPQTAFTVMAGVLFGWRFGTVWASIGMTMGAAGAFFLSRCVARQWFRMRFQENRVYRKIQDMSREHPVRVIALSRIIPVIPFPLASYMLGATEVRAFPYVFLTWLCMLPETLFFASGGHLLHSGLAGEVPIEAVVGFGVLGIAVGVAVHRLRHRFLEKNMQ